DSESAAALEGTVAHALAETLLTSGGKAVNYIDTTPVKDGPPVTNEMAEHVQAYVDTIRQLASGNTLFVEQRVNFSNVIDVADSFGTADAIIIAGDELQIHDLKYGFSRVDAQENEQLQLYALGALHHFGFTHDFNA